jgi:hypothetical protein
MSRLRLPVLLLALALPLTLAACGGDDDDDGGGDDEAQITETIEASSTGTDPADCSTYATENFLDQLEVTTPDETALESCEADAADPSGNPDSVEVSEISVDGDAATANASFSGGGFDGSTFALALVKEGDQWKLDELTDIPTLDLEAFKAVLDEQLQSDASLSPESAQCVSEAFAGITEDQVKDILVNNNDAAFFALLEGC